MRKYYLVLFVVWLPLDLLASDEITIDSMFKENDGLRSISTVEYITSGSTRKFGTYPDLVSYDDGQLLIDSKKVVLNQTFLYALSNKLDLIFSGNGSYQSLQYNSTSGYEDEEKANFDSLWVGFDYKFDSIGQKLKPSITVEVPFYERPYYNSEYGENYFKAVYTKAQMRYFSDPIITTVYVSILKNFEKSIGDSNIKYPDSYGIGYDIAFIVNPDISINLNFEQRYQTIVKENGEKVNPSTNIPTMGIGVSYSIDEKNAFSIAGSVGNSSNAPDSSLAMSLWHKF